MTLDDLRKLEKLEKLATPGPWSAFNDGKGTAQVDIGVAIRNAAPALIACAEALKPFAEPPEANQHSGPSSDYDNAREALRRLEEVK